MYVCARFGGQVIDNLVIQPIYVGSNVRVTDQLTKFYKAVVTGNFMNFLSQEYSTPKQKISTAGTARDPVFVTDGIGSTITQTQIESRLTVMINAGLIPKPNDNILYALHFAPGVGVSMNDGSQSCNVGGSWCGIHGGYYYVDGSTKLHAYYQLLPDFSLQYSSSCYWGCGTTTSVESEKVRVYC